MESKELLIQKLRRDITLALKHLKVSAEKSGDKWININLLNKFGTFPFLVAIFYSNRNRKINLVGERDEIHIGVMFRVDQIKTQEEHKRPITKKVGYAWQNIGNVIHPFAPLSNGLDFNDSTKTDLTDKDDYEKTKRWALALIIKSIEKVMKIIKV